MNGESNDESVRFLNELNRELKNAHPIDPRDAVIRRQYGMTQMCINTVGCTAGSTGSCLFCNYPRGNAVTVESAESAMDELMQSIEPGDRSVLVGSCGSIFDSSEVPDDVREVVLERLSVLKDMTIIFESRIETVREELLCEIKKKLGSNRINLEFGLESADPFVQRYCLNKRVDLDTVVGKIPLIHAHGFTVTANVLVGAPFLTEREQIASAIDSVRWALDNGIDEIVLFPVNVRHGTLLKELYDLGLYEPVNYGLMISVLKNLDERSLDRISFSWSDPKEVDDPIICAHPIADDPKNFEFFRRFMSEHSSDGRKCILEEYAEGKTIAEPLDIDRDAVMQRTQISVSELKKKHCSL